MTQLETLIQTLCPNGVKMVKLGDVANIQYGFPFNASLFTDEKNEKPIIRIRDIVPAQTSTYYSGTVEGLDNYIIHRGDILLGMDGYFNMEKWDSEDAYLNQRVCKISTKNKDIVLEGFLFHYLRPQFKKIEQTTAGGSVIHLSAKIINNLQIPLPPLAVQSEIVRILDKFTLYKSELAAELAARLQQYEYYRDQLLTFDDTVKRVKLGEVAEISRGVRVVRKDLLTSGEIPVYQNSLKPLGYFGQYNTPACTTFVISAGAAGEIGFSNVDYWAADDCLRIIGNKIDNKYVYYWLLNNQNKILSQVRKASIPRLSKDVIINFPIPLPSLSEQERIVSILDRFDALCHDIREGLPAEIDLRQKQYEHYRDKLLTFEAKG